MRQFVKQRLGVLQNILPQHLHEAGVFFIYFIKMKSGAMKKEDAMKNHNLLRKIY
jgi:hypothetical protein